MAFLSCVVAAVSKGLLWLPVVVALVGVILSLAICVIASGVVIRSSIVVSVAVRGAVVAAEAVLGVFAADAYELVHGALGSFSFLLQQLVVSQQSHYVLGLVSHS